MALDALVVAAHPDDAEISLGGTILCLRAAGKRVGVCDFTRGEMGTRGSAADRTRETAAANELMGLELRANLEAPDGRVEHSTGLREALARLMREHRPRAVFAHHTEDLHPDHAAAGRITREAWYLAGLAKLAQQDGATAHRPARIYHFVGHVPFEPTFVVDISEFWGAKRELIRCYASQLAPTSPSDRGEHLLFGSDILSRAETKARYFGELIGRPHGEPLLHRGPLPLDDPLVL